MKEFLEFIKYATNHGAISSGLSLSRGQLIVTEVNKAQLQLLAASKATTPEVLFASIGFQQQGKTYRLAVSKVEQLSIGVIAKYFENDPSPDFCLIEAVLICKNLFKEQPWLLGLLSALEAVGQSPLQPHHAVYRAVLQLVDEELARFHPSNAQPFKRGAESIPSTAKLLDVMNRSNTARPTPDPRRAAAAPATSSTDDVVMGGDSSAIPLLSIGEESGVIDDDFLQVIAADDNQLGLKR